MTITEGAQQTDAGAPGGTPTGAGTQPAPTAGATLTQEQVNAILADEKRTWKRQQDEAAAKVKREAEEAAAKQAGEWEKLATTAATERDRVTAEHTTATERLTALTDAMEKQIKARIKALPDELQGLIPDTADVLTRYELIGKAEAAAAKLTGRQAGSYDINAGARSTGSTTKNDVVTAEIEHMQQSGRYGGF